MNAVVRPTDLATAVEEPRHRFTVADVEAMMRAGLVEEGAREELIEGELVTLPEGGELHRDYSAVLGRWLFRALDDSFVVMPGTTLVLSDHNAPSPDWCVFDASLKTGDVRGPDVVLAIEQADSSVRRDLGWKAKLYARHGVRGHWVIELDAARIHVHRGPGAEGFTSVETFEREDVASSLLVPGLSLRLADLPRVGG